MPFVSDAKKMASFRKYDMEKSEDNYYGFASSKEEENMIDWATFYRRNPGIYAEHRLRMNLLPYQHYMLWQMFNAQTTFDMCSRNSAKTYVLGTGSVIRCLLFPNTEVVIVASTIDQANKMIERKIRDEIIMKHSEVLRHFLEIGMIEVKRDNDTAVVLFPFNGSSIRVLPMVDSARGERCCWLILEEAMQLKKHIISSVFNPMKRPRQADYLRLPEFKKNKRWIEQAMTTYITSNRFKSDWAYKDFTNCVTGFYMNKRVKYKVFAFDIFNVIEEGLKTEEYLIEALKTDSELSIRQELYNEAVGEAEDAFFSYKEFRDNQVLQQCFRPPTQIEFLSEIDLKNKPKDPENEIRLVCVDFAFANTTSREKNDATIIQLVSGHWNGEYFERHWDYLESHEASDSLGAGRRVRELFFDYDADYVVMDKNNGGEVIFNSLTEMWNHPIRGNKWNPHGLTVSNRPELHVLPANKIDDYRSRTVDKEAIPCIIPIGGTSELNSEMWYNMKKEMSCKHCKFLIDEKEYQEYLEDSGEYFNLSSEEFAEKMMPYVQTNMLIYEAINLEATYTNEKVKLSEKRSMTKDMAVVMAYANYIISKIENQWAQSKQTEEIDIKSIQLVW